MPKSAAPGPRGSASSSCRSRSCRSIRKRWSSSTSTMASWPRRSGVPRYVRAPTVGAEPQFIAALAACARDRRTAPLGAEAGLRICPASQTLCPCARRMTPRGAPIPGSRRCTSSASSPGWRGCSICRGFSFTMPARQPGSDASETFKVMERRLLRGIMNPAMIATMSFGIAACGDAGRGRLGDAAGSM